MFCGRSEFSFVLFCVSLVCGWSWFSPQTKTDGKMPQVAADPTKPSPQREIRGLLHLLRLQTKVSTHPSTFSNVLSLHSERLHAPSFCYAPSPDQLTFRYTIHSSLMLTNLDTTTTLSTYAALLDEVTNWVLWATKTAPPVYKAKKRPRQQYPETLVNLTWGPAAEYGLYPGSVVDITATITQNKNHVVTIETEVRDKEFGGVVCYGTHSRTIPKGGSSRLRFLATSWFNNLFVSVPHMPLQHNMCQLFNALDFQTQTSAYFTASPEHASACGRYPLHEGCQVMLMELFGRQVAMSELVAPTAHLQSIQDLSYRGAPTIKVELTGVVQRGTTRSSSRRRQRTVTMTVFLRRMDGTLISQSQLVYCDSLELMIPKPAAANNSSTPIMPQPRDLRGGPSPDEPQSQLNNSNGLAGRSHAGAPSGFFERR